jgi:3-isopropylmalate dehydrogenase
LLLRHSFQLEREATCIENAVHVVLNQGSRTADLAGAGQKPVTTSEMGRNVVEAVRTTEARPKSA